MSRLDGLTVGQYKLIEQIGRGGMATVYRAHQLSLDRMVAVKILPADVERDRTFLERFRREATSIARLRHPNILTVFDFGEDQGLTYIVMEYVSSGTLKECLGRPLPLEWTIEIVRQVAEALDYAHRQGIVHRDIKPANVLMAHRGGASADMSVGLPDWALLSDFGIAKIMEASSVGLTGAGVGLGTPEYMSPEQGRGSVVDGRSDIYSLGIVLFQMLTGVLPFAADTPIAVVMMHINGEMPRPRAINPALSPAIEQVILKATAKKPEDRYQTAGEMVQALRIAASQQSAGGGSYAGSKGNRAGNFGSRTVADAGCHESTTEEEIAWREPRPRNNTTLYLIGGGAIIFICLTLTFGSLAALYFSSGGGPNKPSPTAYVIVKPTATSGVTVQATATAKAIVQATPVMVWPSSATAVPRNALSPTPLPASPTVKPLNPGQTPVLNVEKGALLFSEDFNDNINGWPEVSSGTATSWLKTGQYHILLSTTDLFRWGTPAKKPEYQDFIAEVNVSPVDGPAINSYGLMFRGRDSSNFYDFRLAGSGYYQFVRKQNDQWIGITDWTASKAIKLGNQANTIRVDAKGNLFKFYVNGTLLGTYRDDAFASGILGLSASTFKEPGTHIAFDSFRVWAIK